MALRGIKVVEMAGLAPAPFCGMIMADFGASVIRIDKTSGPDMDRLGRGKRSVALDLKRPEGISVARRLCSSADVLIEPFRKGVMENLGLGPDILTKDNPRLIYARLTGFGQSGPCANMAGHDINYVALTGLLSVLGRKEGPPTPPVNLLADFAGGGLLCALGITLALLERMKSGQGQVIDANMVEGAAYVGSWIYASQDMVVWGKPRGQNWLDSGAHFYDTYETSDGRHMAVGAIEPQFYAQFISLLGLDPDECGQFDEPDDMKKNIAKRFREKTQAEWVRVFSGTDACVTPVLSMDEAPHHPHNVSRKTFMPSPYSPGHYVPRPAPLLSRTPATLQPGVRVPRVGENTVEILTETGYSKEVIEKLLKDKIVTEAKTKAKM